RRHRLSAIFLDRGDPVPQVDTFLEVFRIDRLPLGMSSTRIRDALRGRCSPRVLAGVPFTVFRTIRALGLYGASRVPMDEHAHPVAAPRRTESTVADMAQPVTSVPSAGYSNAVPCISFKLESAG
ncbi:MAG TPA: hypothetical protein VMC79_04120, partial [Rectinemataceae bacterium]|nr:hypothetical protein [Rectinemataceae bacterium]